jgi:hypothetical protein
MGDELKMKRIKAKNRLQKKVAQFFLLAQCCRLQVYKEITDERNTFLVKFGRVGDVNRKTIVIRLLPK